MAVGQGRQTGRQRSAASDSSWAGPRLREYGLYLPLYNGVESLKIGVSMLRRLPGSRRDAKPVVFYGTSITHGGCASRPGMVHTAILGRRLDRPVVNLGFSGNGRMDAAVGEYLGRSPRRST